MSYFDSCATMLYIVMFDDYDYMGANMVAPKSISRTTLSHYDDFFPFANIYRLNKENDRKCDVLLSDA